MKSLLKQELYGTGLLRGDRKNQGETIDRSKNRTASARGWLGSGQVAGTFPRHRHRALCGTVKINSWLIDRSRRRSNVKKGSGALGRARQLESIDSSRVEFGLVKRESLPPATSYSYFICVPTLLLKMDI